MKTVPTPTAADFSKESPEQTAALASWRRRVFFSKVIGSGDDTPAQRAAAMSKEDQVVSAVAYSKAHGITLVQALKTLGFCH